jgi:hypothetical protein
MFLKRNNSFNKPIIVMINKVIFPGLLLAAFIAGCDKPREVVYSNDAEQAIGWINQHTLRHGQGAHSGGWVSHTDSAFPYSLTLREKWSDLRKAGVKKVSSKAWVKFVSMSAKGGLVVSVEDQGKALVWEMLPLDSIVKKEGEWTQVKLDIPLKSDLPPGSVISAYVWNTSKDTILIDDMEVRFLSE